MVDRSNNSSADLSYIGPCNNLGQFNCMQGRTLASFMFRRSIFHRPQIAQLFDLYMLISAAWTQRPAVIAVISALDGHRATARNAGAFSRIPNGEAVATT